MLYEVITPQEEAAVQEAVPVQEVLSAIRNKSAETESKFSACPDCGSPLYAEEGCFKCSNAYCGYSKCS